MHHMGYGDYFSRSVKLADGTPFVRKTADVVIHLLKENARLRPGLAGERSTAGPRLSFNTGHGFAEQPEQANMPLQTVAVHMQGRGKP